MYYSKAKLKIVIKITITTVCLSVKQIYKNKKSFYLWCNKCMWHNHNSVQSFIISDSSREGAYAVVFGTSLYVGATAFIKEF